jgi:hypothetical protein
MRFKPHPAHCEFVIGRHRTGWIRSRLEDIPLSFADADALPLTLRGLLPYALAIIFIAGGNCLGV